MFGGLPSSKLSLCRGDELLELFQVSHLDEGLRASDPAARYCCRDLPARLVVNRDAEISLRPVVCLKVRVLCDVVADSSQYIRCPSAVSRSRPHLQTTYFRVPDERS